MHGIAVGVVCIKQQTSIVDGRIAANEISISGRDIGGGIADEDILKHGIDEIADGRLVPLHDVGLAGLDAVGIGKVEGQLSVN